MERSPKEKRASDVAALRRNLAMLALFASAPTRVCAVLQAKCSVEGAGVGGENSFTHVPFHQIIPHSGPCTIKSRCKVGRRRRGSLTMASFSG